MIMVETHQEGILEGENEGFGEKIQILLCAMLYGNEDSIFRIELGYRYNYFNKDLKYQW